MSTLIVPINVAALCVGNPDAANSNTPTTWPQADFSLLPTTGQSAHKIPYLNSVLFSKSQPLAGDFPFVAAVHLHWALPAALSQGNQTEDSSDLTLPNVPNRWLVTRIIQNTASPATTPPQIKSWVIESDRLNPSPVGIAASTEWQPSVPLAPTTSGQNYMYVGQAFDLATWSETTAQRLMPLTAAGYGEHAFAGFYPNCSSVFGFADTFADNPDLTDGVISYRVSGWYSDPSLDPLNAGITPDNTFNWTFTANNTATATICSGFVQNITYDPSQTYLTDQANPLSAAIAPTGPEAIACLLTSELNSTNFPDAEALINAIQFGLLTREGNIPNAAQRFEERVHGAGFETVSSAPLWEYTPVVGYTDPAPKGAVAALHALNKAQTALNTAQAAVFQQQQQLFADWYKYILAAYNASPDVPSALSQNIQSVLNFLTNEATNVQNAVTALTPLQTNVTTAQQTLQSLLGSNFTLTGDKSAPRYYLPHDPVLAFSGIDVQPVDRTGLDAQGNLNCRLDVEILSSVAVAAGFFSSGDAETIQSSQLPGLEATPADGPATLLQTLMQETYLLSASLLAGALATADGASSSYATDFGDLVTSLQTAISNFLGGVQTSDITFTGLAPNEISVTTMGTTQPWLPLLLQFEIALQPAQVIDFSQTTPGSYSTDFLTSNFALDANGVELEPSQYSASTQAIYKGTAILTDGALSSLQDALNRFIDNTGGTSELQALQTALPTLPQLAQGLTGANASWMMQGQSVQMPVFDPNAGLLVGSYNAIATAVGQANSLDAQPTNLFGPIRAGALTIQQIWVLDVFGQHRAYMPGTTPLVANSLTPPVSLNLPAGTAFLPPRFLQPSRLLFRWLSAKDEKRVESTGGDRLSTPIYGWVMSDLSDRGLFVYSGDGTALLTLTLSADNSQVLYTPAPGGKFPPGTDISTILAGQNPKLAAFVQQALVPAFFQPFLATLTNALTFIRPLNPAADPARAVLAGAPLALGDADLQFELLGPPSVDQSWPGFEGVALQDGTPARSDAGFAEVQLPVQLGDLRQLNDGLVGFWLTNGGTTDFTNFYSETASGSSGGVQTPDAATILLTAADTAPTTVTLLFDPRGSVHATTGVLPVKSIDLPAELFAGTLAGLEMTFTTAPLLTGPQTGTITLPLPGAEQKAWSWVQAQGSAWSVQTPQDATAIAGLQTTPQQIAEGWLRTKEGAS